MKKISVFVGFFLFLFFAYGVFLSIFDVQIISPTKANKNELFWDYRGITHVVTKHTRGSLFPKDILIEAGAAGVDFLFLTDLNLMSRPYSIHGYHGNVFTFTNQKISYLDSHILVYSKNTDFTFSSIINAQTQISDHVDRNIFDELNPFLAVLAHPFKKNHQWHGEISPGIDGIEVLNLRKLWQELWNTDRGNFILSVLFYPFNPKLALMRILKDPQQELLLWDQMNQKRKTLGLLGSQTTARIFHLVGLNFSFPTYLESFKFASNHILLQSELTGVESRDRDKIFSAFQKGQFYFALDIFGSPSGFGAYIKDQKKLKFMGEKISFQKGMILHVDLPPGINVPWEIELYQDGKKVQVSKETTADFNIDTKGVYRVVVRIQPKLPFPEASKWFSWIYTNNFFIQ